MSSQGSSGNIDPDGPTTSGYLSNVKLSDLRRIQRYIRRNEAELDRSLDLPLHRNIDDPSKICAYVHKTGIHSKPIFGRDIKVNQVFSKSEPRTKDYEEARTVIYSRSQEDRISREKCICREISSSPEKRHSYVRTRNKHESRKRTRRSRSRSLSPHEHEHDCPLYSSQHRHRSRTRSPKRRSNRYRSRSPRRRHRQRSRSRSCEVHRRKSRSRSLSPNCSYHRSSERSRYREDESSRHRNTSPETHQPDCPVHRYSEFHEGSSHIPFSHMAYRYGRSYSH